MKKVLQRTPPPVTWRLKAIYGSGAMAYAIKDFGFNYYLLFFYSQVVGLPASWVSAAIMLALMADAVIDLFIGQISDNWRSRWGRRHPFMYAAALPAVVSFALLWNPPHLPTQSLVIYFITLTILVRAWIALYEIPASALLPDLARDYNERTSFFSYRVFFAYLGGFGFVLFSASVLFKDTPGHIGQLDPAAYARFGVYAGLVMLISMLVAAIGTQGRIPFLSPPPARQATGPRQAFREVRHTFSNPSLLTLVVASISANVATGLYNGLTVFLYTYFWGLTAAQFAIVLPGIFVGAILGPIVAPLLSRRFGKKPSGVWLAILSVLLNMGPYALRLIGLFPSTGTALVAGLFVIGLIASTLGIAATVIILSMLADTVEDSEVVTGRRSEGLVLASNTFSNKCGSGLGIFLSGLIVTAVHLPAHAAPGSVTPAIIDHLVLIFLPLNTLLYVIWIALISRYRITRERYEDNLARLELRGQGVAGREPASGEELAAGPTERGLGATRGSIVTPSGPRSA